MKKHTKYTSESMTPEKSGFFKRLFDKVDSSMKEKSKKQSEQSSCCGSDDSNSKGGKCC